MTLISPGFSLRILILSVPTREVLWLDLGLMWLSGNLSRGLFLGVEAESMHDFLSPLVQGSLPFSEQLGKMPFGTLNTDRCQRPEVKECGFAIQCSFPMSYGNPGKACSFNSLNFFEPSTPCLRNSPDIHSSPLYSTVMIMCRDLNLLSVGRHKTQQGESARLAMKLSQHLTITVLSRNTAQGMLPL